MLGVHVLPVWVALGFNEQTSRMAEQEFRMLFETCVAATGKGYEAAAEKIDEINQHKGVYGGPPPRYNRTWQERWVQRILRARSANPERFWDPGSTHRKVITFLRDREGAAKRQRPREIGALIAQPHLVDPRYHSGRKAAIGATATTELPADVEFLWKLSEGTDPSQRIRAIEGIGISSGVFYWLDLGFSLGHVDPHLRDDDLLWPDLGELLAYLLEREADAWVARKLQEVLAMLPDERVLDAVRKRASDTKLAEAMRQRFAEIVPVMQEYHERLKSKAAQGGPGTTKPSP